MAVICSGVGPTTRGPCSGLAALSESLTSPGVNVLAGTFLAASSASFDEKSLAASILSYKSRNLSSIFSRILAS